jgi:hypothetical protein
MDDKTPLLMADAPAAEASTTAATAQTSANTPVHCRRGARLSSDGPYRLARDEETLAGRDHDAGDAR